MKIAVYFSGQARFLGEGEMWKPITDMFVGHEVDFYFHFWENNEYSKEYILNVFKPKNYKFQPQVDFTDQATYILNHLPKAKLPLRGYFNMMSFYYSFAQAHEIVPLDQYDYICKTRTDVRLERKLDHLLDGKENIINIHPTRETPTHRLNDLCFLGTSKTFSRLLDVAKLATSPGDYIEDYLKKMELRFTSHTYLSYAFRRYNLKNRQIHMVHRTLPLDRKGKV